MKLAITGGAGFLGYHLANQLKDKFDEIFLIDIEEIDPKEYPQNIRFFKVDVRDKDSLEKALKNVDLIVHGAAALPLWKKEDIFSTNVNGTKNVLDIALKYKIERVVFVSSTAVYGIPKKHPIYEDDPLIGVGPYGESKIIAENICKEYRKKGLIVPIVRPKTFIGTGRMGVFGILYDWVKDGKRIPLIGNGKNRYQLLEVEDLVDAIYLMLTLPADVVNDTFNIGAKEFGTVYEDVKALCDYAGTGAKPLPTPSWLVKPILEILWTLRLSPLYKWVYGTADKDSFVSTEKAEKKLGWKPKYNNAQALIRSYKWFIEHYDEVMKETGVKHRTLWKQGVLKIVKWIL